jgi:hypothetical protein
MTCPCCGEGGGGMMQTQAAINCFRSAIKHRSSARALVLMLQLLHVSRHHVQHVHEKV